MEFRVLYCIPNHYPHITRYSMTQTCLKKTGLPILLALAFLLAGCGSGSSSGNINGGWTATLTDPNGQSEFAFTTSFTQGSGSNLNIVNFKFTTAGSCFTGDTTTQTGSFSFSGDFNGNVTGTLGMTISTQNLPTNNVLTLQGAVNGNTITGTWTLTGATGCTGNGTFTMNHT